MDKSKVMLLTKTETVHQDTVRHGSPTHRPQSCIMQPTATCVNNVCPTELHNNFRQLCVPHLVIFTCAAHTPAQNNSCDPFPEKIGCPCCRYFTLKTQNLYKKYNVTYFETESVTALLMMTKVFWEVTVCWLVRVTDVLEEGYASIFNSNRSKTSTAILKPIWQGTQQKMFAMLSHMAVDGSRTNFQNSGFCKFWWWAKSKITDLIKTERVYKNFQGFYLKTKNIFHTRGCNLFLDCLTLKIETLSSRNTSVLSSWYGTTSKKTWIFIQQHFRLS